MVKRAWDSRTVDGNGGGVRTRVDTERGEGRRTQREGVRGEAGSPAAPGSDSALAHCFH